MYKSALLFCDKFSHTCVILGIQCYFNDVARIDWTFQIQNLKEKEAKLNRELGRLREHLIQVRDI